MNNSFESFYEFRKPDVFLSKEFYFGKSEEGYDFNIIQTYEKILKSNFINYNQIYFSIKNGCITYNQNNEEDAYFQKWFARLLAPKYKISNLTSIEHILNQSYLISSEFYIFKKFTPFVSNEEIRDTIYGVIGSRKNLREFPNDSTCIIDDFSKKILTQLFIQYHITSVQQSMHDMSLTEILNYGKEQKPLIH